MLETQDLKDFSIHTWYPKFQKICIRTLLVEIPDDLIENIKTGDSTTDIKDICSNLYLETLQNCLNELNNSVFLKNNWHAPMDAKMFSLGNLLKATNIHDLLLYLSTSNIISEDFSSVLDFPFLLALRPWKSIHPASEFRCIVFNNNLRAITPRDWPTFYPHFLKENKEIIKTVSDFFKEHIQGKFHRKHYTFDIVVSFPDEPYILDFGPLNSKVDLYAFKWKEISPLLNKTVPAEISPVFRYLESDIGITTKTDALYKITKAYNDS